MGDRAEGWAGWCLTTGAEGLIHTTGIHWRVSRLLTYTRTLPLLALGHRLLYRHCSWLSCGGRCTHRRSG